MAPSKPLYIVYNRIRVIVRLTTKASRNTVTGLTQEANGGVVIKASVTAMPKAGKTNTALLNLLAKEWNLPKLSLKIIRGNLFGEKPLKFRVIQFLYRMCLRLGLTKLVDTKT